jgi:hypothetical protein
VGVTGGAGVEVAKRRASTAVGHGVTGRVPSMVIWQRSLTADDCRPAMLMTSMRLGSVREAGCGATTLPDAQSSIEVEHGARHGEHACYSADRSQLE